MAGFGLPGSPAFIASELVLHGTWQAHPAFSVLVAVAQGLASVALWRAWTLAYLGQPTGARSANAPSAVSTERPLDATRRERSGALALAGVGLLLGVMPALALNFEAPAVDHLLRQVEPEAHAPAEPGVHDPHSAQTPSADTPLSPTEDTASSTEPVVGALPLK